MKMSFAEKLLWAFVALSSIGAAAYGYNRFKQIRPDLYGQPPVMGVSESERAARIAEYQQKGDALTRAAAPARKLAPGETCANGVVLTIVRDGDKAEAKAVVENGQPVRCDASR